MDGWMVAKNFQNSKLCYKRSFQNLINLCQFMKKSTDCVLITKHKMDMNRKRIHFV